MSKPFHRTLIDLHEALGPRRIVEVDATGAQRLVEILDTTGETISDEGCRPLYTSNNVIPFAASLRRVS
jgi:hypothetical protein